jgi:hypothetical protein
MGQKGYAHRILVGKPEGKRPLGRTRRRWVDDIKMDLRGLGSSEEEKYLPLTGLKHSASPYPAAIYN